MSDDAAFLRAIASDPADDTARLAYADFLEETGDEVHAARAGFIRTQVEAHTCHPNDPRRAGLEVHAAELFAEHWIDWWSPVCAATGLPRPHVPSDGLRARLGRVLLGRTEPRRGYPYTVDGPTTLGWVRPPLPAQLDSIRSVAFERGFPQWVSLTGQLNDVARAIRRWTEAAPLTALHLLGTVALDWRLIDGEHLHGVRDLALLGTNTAAVRAVAASPHLPRLEELSLRPDRSNAAWPVELYRAYAESPLAGRVKWLKVVIGSPNEAPSLHGPHLANLLRLHVVGVSADLGGESAGWVQMGTLALIRSEHLTGLKELWLSGPASRVAAGLPDWLAGRLRRLVVDDLQEVEAPFSSLIRRDPLSALTDLSLTTASHRGTVYSALADSPLAGRLRHLRVIGTGTNSAWGSERLELLRLAEALNPEKLETLALDRRVREWPNVWDELQERFPGRVSVV